jgi:GMP synthase (glutamine-hydrolysing)
MQSIVVLQHVPHEDLGSLETHFRQAGLDWRYVQLYREVPDALDWANTAGLVVLGGPMNVDEVDQHPFLGKEVVWIREAVERGIPMLGICLGSQLLAKAMGAKVRPNRVKEIGWYEIDLTDAAREDPLFGGCPAKPVVFQWHGDTFDIPPGAVHLASSPRCRNQALRCGTSAWGLQFHVEMTGELVERWLAEPGNCCELGSLDYIDTAEIRRRMAWGLEQMLALGDVLLPRFAALCK